MDGVKVFLLLQLLSCAYGKHLPKPHHNERKSYPRQMIIPNKFIPMLKQSSLFKSRSSSNDLSSFLQPMSHEHDSVTGQTRQNLMDSMGMDPGQSQTGTGDTNGMGGMGQAGGMGEAGGMGGAGGMGEGGMNGMGGAGGMGMNGGTGGMGETGGMGTNGGMGGMGETGGMGMNGGMGGTGMEGAGGFGGLSDQMKAMNEIGGNMQGENGMNPMNNGGAEGMNSDANNPPAGDPMGTLKDMLSNQGTNAALGTDSQAFGPGGAASSNVLAMLNQVVGKEMPGESPVDPSSSSEQVWNQLQKTLDSQKPSGVPYIDPAESKSANEHVQQDVQVSNSNNKMNVANKPNPNTPAIPMNNNSTPNISTKKPPISNAGNASPLNANSVTSNAPIAHDSMNSPATNPTSTTNIISKSRSQKESHANALPKTTSNMAEMDAEEDRPLSADMIKFLKGVKFVVSQEPGNDIILGKKFSSDAQHDLTLDLKEENGVIKNIVSASNKLSRADRMWPMRGRGERYGNVETANPKGIVSSFAITHLLSKPNAKKNNPVEYIKAAKVLERASKKLKDPIAKKSTEIAVASILKVAASGENKNLSSNAAADLLNGGDVNNKLSEKYIEAARVLGTASKKLVDPVAKKSTEIGIASILKVIVLGDYPTSKKTFVPSLHHSHSPFNTHVNTLVDKRHENIANEIVAAVKSTLKLTKMKKPSP